MVVLLVVLTFALFVVIDIFKERHHAALLVAEGESLHNAIEEAEPIWAGGYELPGALAYHPGHTWVHWVSEDQAYVGLDDFARRLLGKHARLELPSEGTHLSQGEDAVIVDRNGIHASVLTPVAGEVIGVNPRLDKDPDLAFRDSYGRGWLFKIRSPRLHRDLSNLLSGTLARRWMEDTRDRFQRQLMVATGSVIQDGGAPLEDLGSGLTDSEWRSLVDEFLTLRPQRH